MKDVKKFSAILIISIYVISVSIISIYIYQALLNAGLCTPSDVCLMRIPIYYFIPLFSAVGLATGGIMFYLISERIDTKLKKYKKEQKQKINELYSKLLSDEENKIFNLLKKEKKINQSDISKKLEMSRVKVYRNIKKLIKKNLIEKKKDRKSVTIYFKE